MTPTLPEGFNISTQRHSSRALRRTRRSFGLLDIPAVDILQSTGAPIGTMRAKDTESLPGTAVPAPATCGSRWGVRAGTRSACGIFSTPRTGGGGAGLGLCRNFAGTCVLGAYFLANNHWGRDFRRTHRHMRHQIEAVTSPTMKVAKKQHPRLSLNINGNARLPNTLTSAPEAEVTFWVVSVKGNLFPNQNGQT